MAQVTEKRRNRRLRLRLRVVLDEQPTLAATTVNISRTGLCISTDYLPHPGTEITGAVLLPSGEGANFEATVVWVRRIKGSLDQKNLLGVEFVIPPGEEFNALIDQTLRTRQDHTPVVAAVEGDAPPPRTAPMAVTPDSAGLISLVGQIGRATVTVNADDLAAPAARFGSTISPTAAARMAEEAAARSVIALLPGGAITVGVSLQLSLAHDPPTAIGTRLTTIARVIDVSPDGSVLTFDFKIDDGERTVARGRHARAVLAPPPR